MPVKWNSETDQVVSSLLSLASPSSQLSVLRNASCYQANTISSYFSKSSKPPTFHPNASRSPRNGVSPSSFAYSDVAIFLTMLQLLIWIVPPRVQSPSASSRYANLLKPPEPQATSAFPTQSLSPAHPVRTQQTVASRKQRRRRPTAPKPKLANASVAAC